MTRPRRFTTLRILMGLVTLDSGNLDYTRSHEFCRLLEEGEILFFADSPIRLSAGETAFLLGQKQVEAGYRKNIAYKPEKHIVSGASGGNTRRLLEVMESFSQSVTRFLKNLLAPYAASWHLDYASFRPRQEMGRRVKFKARNDLLHVDAFPTRPTYGDRILRCFVNINPTEPRDWVVADTFEHLLGKYVGTPDLPLPPAEEAVLQRFRRQLSRWGKSLGLPLAAGSRYDEFMLRLHDSLKANQSFQEQGVRHRFQFPPGSCWIVFTDFVPHAALSGQFALEQTLIIDHRSMLLPEKAPIRLLEKASGANLLA